MATITLTAPADKLALMLAALKDAEAAAEEIATLKAENEQLIEDVRFFAKELDASRNYIAELKKNKPKTLSVGELETMLEEYDMPDYVRTRIALDIAFELALN